MFTRFITSYLDIDGEKNTGVFQALGCLRRSVDTAHVDVEKLFTLRDWFDQYLEAPDQFTKRKTNKDTGIALGWYRDTAFDHIAKMYELAKIC